MKLINTCIAVGAIALSQQVAATVITHGNLTTDDSTNYITDTLTGRQYTRADAFDLTYAQTLAAVGVGGAFEGWSIATGVEADDFISAALGVSSSPCAGAASYGTHCGNVSGWNDGDFGASYVSSYDYFAYQTTSGGSPISLIEFYAGSTSIRDYESWSSESSLDYYSGNYAINLLLFNDNVVVSEPGTFVLFGLGLIGLGISRRKAKA